MAIDAQLIGSEFFNLKIKNYLRDFFVYQFKEKNQDFKQKGIKTESKTFIALAPGEVIITATTVNGLKAQCVVIVNPSEKDKSKEKNSALRKKTKVPEKISFKTKSIEMPAGVFRKITVQVLPDRADKCVVFSSSDESVAKIVSGKILAVGQGCCEITATTVNGLTDKCTVKVKGEEVLPASLMLDSDKTEVNVGEEFRLTAFVEPIKTTNLEIHWSSSDNRIVKCPEGTTLALFMEEMLNKNIIDSMFNYDTGRLRYALEEAVGISWSKGDYQSESGKKSKKKENKLVECITADASKLLGNPFFSLYKLCSESALEAGTHFSLIYAILLYFQLGKRIAFSDYKPISEDDIKRLNYYLIEHAEICESKEAKRRIREWSCFSEETKRKFALKAIELFYSDHDEMPDIYDYIALNRQQIVFCDGKFSVVDAEFVEKSVLYYAMKKAGFLKQDDDKDKAEKQEKQFSNKLHELTRLGILRSENRDHKIYYALSDMHINDLFCNNNDLLDRFTDCVYFFSQIGLMGETADGILRRLGGRAPDYIHTKHNYILRSLNDFNNSDLIYAIKNNLCVILEYRNGAVDDLVYQRILCYPIEIRESVFNGREFLIYYHPILRSVSAVRIEFIDSITLGEMPEPEYFEADMVRAKKLIMHTWGTAFSDFWNKNVATPFEMNRVRMIIRYGENEDFIRSRLFREKRDFVSIREIKSDSAYKYLEAVAEVENTRELVPWLRSYISRVVTVEINGKEFTEFVQDVERSYNDYLMPTQLQTGNSFSGKSVKPIRDETPEGFIEWESMHNLLFNEIFSIPFDLLGDVLVDIINRKSIGRTDLEKIKENYSSEFFYNKFSSNVNQDTKIKRLAQVDNFIDMFVRTDGTQFSSLFRTVDGKNFAGFQDILPLTTVEIQWLKNILSHPMAKGFLEEDEIKMISDRLGNVDLFDMNSVVLYDRSKELESFYSGEVYSISMRTIMNAIRNSEKVTIKDTDQYGEETEYTCSPVFMEYSIRDNCVRIKALNEDNAVCTVNLESINTAPTEEHFDREAAVKIINEYIENNKWEMVISFNNIKNVPDRLLTEFSRYSKRCSKRENGTYQMTLFYDTDDAQDIMTRLLSYGPWIHVQKDNGTVREELINCLKNQLELIRNVEIIKEININEKN